MLAVTKWLSSLLSVRMRIDERHFATVNFEKFQHSDDIGHALSVTKQALTAQLLVLLGAVSCGDG